MEQQGLEKVWVVHNHGFTVGTVINDTPKRSNLSAHITLVRYQVSTDDRIGVVRREREMGGGERCGGGGKGEGGGDKEEKRGRRE